MEQASQDCCVVGKTRDIDIDRLEQNRLLSSVPFSGKSLR